MQYKEFVLKIGHVLGKKVFEKNVFNSLDMCREKLFKKNVFNSLDKCRKKCLERMCLKSVGGKVFKKNAFNTLDKCWEEKCVK